MRIEGHPYELSIFAGVRPEIHAACEENNGYVALAHGQTYAVRLLSVGVRCRAEIKIDGVSVGKFILSPNVTYDIERPVDSQSKFTFFAVGTDEAAASLQNSIDKNDRGLVEVIFCPQRAGGQHVNCTDGYRKDKVCLNDILRSDPIFGASGASGAFGVSGKSITDEVVTQELSAGVTGLTGHSNQRFTTSHIEVDEDKAVTLRLRLVVDKNKSADIGVKPLSGHLPRETEVPPPLE